MKIILALITFLLVSCGGGGGGGAPAGGAPSSTNFNGVAVDGYLYQARAFLDLNGNGQYDSGEPTATTDSAGGFTLSATQDQINSHSVVVSAIAGTTIDQDNPNTPLASGMTLVAPAGNPSVVSPLTTQVSAKMAGGLSLADAKSAVQTELGLTNIDVMKNFVAEKATNAAYADAHKVAASVAEVLKNIETQSSANTTLANRFSSLTATVTSQVAPNVTQIKAAASVDDAKTVMTTAISQSVNMYTIGGSISGLTASGLVLANGVGTVSPSSGANSFTFSNRKASGASYAVTIQSNPTGQICTLSNGSGNVSNQSITNISISCSNTPGALGGTISGLNTSGIVLKNGSDELIVASGSNSFQFSSTVADSVAYSVTVKTQPTGKTCSVSNGSGTMASAGITNVQVTCSVNSYTISGSISGLVTSGLKLKRGDEVITLSSGATTFSFTNTVAYGASYSVSVDTQPSGYTCNINNSNGTMGSNNVTSVQVSCAINTYNIGGTITNLSGGLTLRLGDKTLNAVTGAISFAFQSAGAYGDSYSLTIATQPLTSRCTLNNASGVVGSGDVTTIQVICTPSYTISVNISGYSTSGLILKSGTSLSTIAEGFQTATLLGRIESGSTYAVAVDTNPAGYNCSVENGTGIATSNVTTVNVSCVAMNVTTFAGSDGVTFANPSGLGFDSSGNLFVVDTGHKKIKKITSAGVVSTFAGSGTSGNTNGTGTNASFGEMWYLALDSQDNIFVADYSNCLIRKITPSAVVTTIAGLGCTNRSVNGNELSAEFNYPLGISIDGSDNIWITEYASGTIKKISFSNSHWVTETVVSDLTHPYGISASKSNDYLYFSTLSSTGVTRYGIATGASDSLASQATVYGVDSDSDGNIYYYGFNTNKIYRGLITPQSISSVVIAGTGASGTNNGISTSATFASPAGGAIGPDGNLYIADNAGQVIRKITLK